MRWGRENGSAWSALDTGAGERRSLNDALSCSVLESWVYLSLVIALRKVGLVPHLGSTVELVLVAEERVNWP